MPIAYRDTQAYRADEKHNGKLLTDQERRRMILANLPKPTNLPVQNTKGSRLGLRRFLSHQIYVIVFAVLHGIFSLYLRIRQMWHAVSYQLSSILNYHHGTPEYIRRDTLGLKRKPEHLSCILTIEDRHSLKAGLELLLDQAAEVATWSACAEIPQLSIYEKTGILKKHMPRVYEAVIRKFTFYFGAQHPSLAITSPHKESYSASEENSNFGHLKLHLISEEDGRDSMVDLTRTLADMSQKGKLSPHDISMELIDAELSEGIMSEPDLLILFGPHVELSGYPPWQVRLTEIFCLPDNEVFGYQVFLKALRNYASAQFRRGK
ncbi:di-trans,poly-cis-decaprenylcistransferase [Stachybotrys elegans]|uniref:ditrans,polycis-polyprenyl diphosphate synthase [(2E,6E)-farnesyldiphosphate specific] n=1 Tax=Stachybotrys elegans TaxID=80388 RepID=A0A8K0SWK2_9HYPO|nr:di-trans,poly-cis-decaprenylcistransferase [Stachybotrys elegans]